MSFLCSPTPHHVGTIEQGPLCKGEAKGNVHSCIHNFIWWWISKHFFLCSALLCKAMRGRRNSRLWYESSEINFIIMAFMITFLTTNEKKIIQRKLYIDVEGNSRTHAKGKKGNQSLSSQFSAAWSEITEKLYWFNNYRSSF